MASMRRKVVGFLFALSLFAGSAQAGPIFLTGHDPDFHAQDAVGAQNLLTIGLNFAMGGLLNNNVDKFLWVESFLSPFGGHRVGADGLTSIGLALGQDYDKVDAAGFATANLSGYKAIAIASTFGAMLTSAELNALIARSADIATFINAGGGLFASAECEATFTGCDSAPTLTAPHGPLFGFLPVTVSAVGTTEPYAVTAFGAGLGLVNSDFNSYCCTHNSFAAIGGLNIVDNDALGVPTTLAGVVTVGGGGFTPVPEPGTISLSLIGLGLIGANHRRRRKS